MSAKRKQPEIKFSSFTPPQKGPAASAILGIQLPKEEDKITDPEPVKETDSEKPEIKKSASVETLISGLKKDSFVSRHQKESFYIENDLHETFFSVTSGIKSAKTQIINMALREFFQNHDIEIKAFTGQYATGTRRKKHD